MTAAKQTLSDPHAQEIILSSASSANPTHGNPPVSPAHLRAILVALDFADTGRGASVDDFQRRSGVAVEDFGRGLLQLSNQGLVADWGKSKWYGPGYKMNDAGRAFLAQPAPAESPAPVAAEPARADSAPVKPAAMKLTKRQQEMLDEYTGVLADGQYHRIADLYGIRNARYNAMRTLMYRLESGGVLDKMFERHPDDAEVITWGGINARFRAKSAPSIHIPNVTPTRAVCVALAPYYPDIVGIAGRLAVAEARARKAAPRPYAAWMPAATHVHPVIVDPAEERAITRTMFEWARESDDWDLATVALNRALGDAPAPDDADRETAQRFARYTAGRDPWDGGDETIARVGWHDPRENSQGVDYVSSAFI